MDERCAPVVWFTGFSGAGKSTIAAAIHQRLSASGVPVELLDGDTVRSFSPAGYSRAGREAHVKRVGYLASRLSAHGVTVVCAMISPYRDSRNWVRQLCPRFIEVHISTPLSECERRDVKGLYAAVRRGEVQRFTGIDDPYEPPLDPECRLDTSSISIDHAVAVVMSSLYVSSGAFGIVEAPRTRRAGGRQGEDEDAGVPGRSVLLQ